MGTAAAPSPVPREACGASGVLARVGEAPWGALGFEKPHLGKALWVIGRSRCGDRFPWKGLTASQLYLGLWECPFWECPFWECPC